MVIQPVRLAIFLPDGAFRSSFNDGFSRYGRTSVTCGNKVEWSPYLKQATEGDKFVWLNDDGDLPLEKTGQYRLRNPEVNNEWGIRTKIYAVCRTVPSLDHQKRHGVCWGLLPFWQNETIKQVVLATCFYLSKSMKKMKKTWSFYALKWETIYRFSRTRSRAFVFPSSEEDNFLCSRGRFIRNETWIKSIFTMR